MRPFRVGDRVNARQARWRVLDVTATEASRMVTLSGSEPDNIGIRRTLLAPFDDIEPIEQRTGPPRPVRPARWRRACRALFANATVPAGLVAARDARMDLHPHQLAPALALVHGLGARMLLADDVGLGKTVQAGLAIAELRARGAADRVLILTPAGLRDQWAAELRDRFELAFEVIDTAAFARWRRVLPPRVNPWTAVPFAITSIDYAKRPEIHPSVSSCRWDVVVVDEAHHAVSGSDRHDAADRLARRAAWVVLVTATPHSGDTGAFTSLCRIGELDGDPLLIFLRTRADIQLRSCRRTHRLLIRPTAAERRMHAALTTFARTVRIERGAASALALSVLHKRACSSARSLHESVKRRLAMLDHLEPEPTAQLQLPLDADGGEQTDDEAPGWAPELTLSDTGRERQLLQRVAEAALAAAARESKIQALRRLLRRLREPAIVFTEYRDTLAHVAAALDATAVLHGGLTREERRTALRLFTGGAERLLLATDAAGEGLNLHHCCRIVINLELPWNPIRLEQRVGRVDRIGQTRTVHAFHFLAAHGERRIADQLDAKLRRVRTELAGVDGARCDVAPDAGAEAKRIAIARRLSSKVECQDDRPVQLHARRSPTRAALRGRPLLIWSASCEDGNGRSVGYTVAGCHVPSLPSGRLSTMVETACTCAVDPVVAVWRAQLEEWNIAFATARLRRARARLMAAAPAGAPPLQHGLFDRRASDAHDTGVEEAAEERRRLTEDIQRIECSAQLVFSPPRLALSLLP